PGLLLRRPPRHELVRHRVGLRGQHLAARAGPLLRRAGQDRLRGALPPGQPPQLLPDLQEVGGEPGTGAAPGHHEVGPAPVPPLPALPLGLGPRLRGPDARRAPDGAPALQGAPRPPQALRAMTPAPPGDYPRAEP